MQNQASPPNLWLVRVSHTNTNNIPRLSFSLSLSLQLRLSTHVQITMHQSLNSCSRSQSCCVLFLFFQFFKLKRRLLFCHQIKPYKETHATQKNIWFQQQQQKYPLYNVAIAFSRCWANWYGFIIKLYKMLQYLKKRCWRQDLFDIRIDNLLQKFDFHVVFEPKKNYFNLWNRYAKE